MINKYFLCGLVLRHFFEGKGILSLNNVDVSKSKLFSFFSPHFEVVCKGKD